MSDWAPSDVVVNASPLIFLYGSGQLELLRLYQGRVFVPSAVVAEVTAKPRHASRAAVVQLPSWAEVLPDIPVPAAVAEWDLGPGESAVLAHARATPSARVVLDDLAARRCARALGLQTTGTLGLVLLAKKSGRIASARDVLSSLRAGGMYLSDAVVERALGLVGEGR